MDKLRAEGAWGPVTERPLFIWGGEIDKSVTMPNVLDQKRYFESVGADIKYEMNPNYGHWWNEKTVAGDISDFCYDKMKKRAKTKARKIYRGSTYSFDDDVYLKKGYLHKWDQEQFVNEIQDVFTANGQNKGKNIDAEFLGLRKWGYVYYPKKCSTQSDCNF